jgi:hypothetical protein
VTTTGAPSLAPLALLARGQTLYRRARTRRKQVSAKGSPLESRSPLELHSGLARYVACDADRATRAYVDHLDVDVDQFDDQLDAHAAQPASTLTATFDIQEDGRGRKDWHRYGKRYSNSPRLLGQYSLD